MEVAGKTKSFERPLSNEPESRKAERREISLERQSIAPPSFSGMKKTLLSKRMEYPDGAFQK
jgi:hypothetical protein